MSAAHGGARRKPGSRAHLVLVRGGLDRSEPEDADWRAFCTRIGWQHAETALPDDYEERLAARIFAEDAWNDGPARSAGEGWPLAPAADPWRQKARYVSMAAAATMAVAAALCVAASVILWRAARPAVSAVACPDVEAPPRATLAPVDPRAAPVEPSEQLRDAERAPRPKDAPSPPAPSETKPHKPTPPGSLVARRSRHDDARPRGAFHPAGWPARGYEPAPPRYWQGASTQSTLPIAAADLPTMAPGMGLRRVGLEGVAPALPVSPRAWPEARASNGWTRPASFGHGVVPASASWSLSPESPRWYGVSLPPSSASDGVPPGIGVMGQFDVVKVLAKL